MSVDLWEIERRATAFRSVVFSKFVIGAVIVDAVREVVGAGAERGERVVYEEDVSYVDDGILYVLARHSNAPAGNMVVVGSGDGDEQTEVFPIDPCTLHGQIAVMSGALHGRQLAKVEGPPLYYKRAKEFGERIRLAVEARIANPSIMEGRPRVALTADETLIPGG